jgi:NADH dehydrogenase FAD-containing subunit
MPPTVVIVGGGYGGVAAARLADAVRQPLAPRRRRASSA